MFSLTPARSGAACARRCHQWFLSQDIALEPELCFPCRGCDRTGYNTHTSHSGLGQAGYRPCISDSPSVSAFFSTTCIFNSYASNKHPVSIQIISATPPHTFWLLHPLPPLPFLLPLYQRFGVLQQMTGLLINGNINGEKLTGPPSGCRIS